MSTGSAPLLNGRVSRELKATAAAKGDKSHLASVKLLSDFFTVWLLGSSSNAQTAEVPEVKDKNRKNFFPWDAEDSHGNNSGPFHFHFFICLLRSTYLAKIELTPDRGIQFYFLKYSQTPLRRLELPLFTQLFSILSAR